MKKHFIVTTVIIETLILIMFLLGTGLFTYIRATSEMKTAYQRMSSDAEYCGGMLFSGDDRSLIMHAHTTIWGYHGLKARPEGTGYYGFIRLADGTIVDTSSAYGVLEIGALIDAPSDYDAQEVFANNDQIDYLSGDHEIYCRIFALNEDASFEPDYRSYVTVDAECDDTFIHSGTMTSNQGNTYEFRDIGYNSSERVPVTSIVDNSQWTVATIYDLARNKYEKGLNSEAKELFENLLNESEQTNLFIPKAFCSEDVITSYYMVLKYSPNGTVAGLIYTFHPVETVLRANMVLYIVLLVVLLFVEGFVAYTMRKSYVSRMEQEMRSRRLRRGIAHELKTPLAIAKLFMENQEYIDESERPEYSRKVNRELEDMTGLIDALLEMDKIDSGKDMLKPEEFDINAMIKSVYSRIKPLADERNLEVILPEDKEYLVKADIKFMRIAIGNYLTNMVKYADKEAQVTVNVHGNSVRVVFENDSANDKKSGIDKLNSNGMGVEINENIMRLHSFKCGSGMYYNKTRFWFEAEKV